MVTVLRAIALAAMLQVAVGAGLTAYLFTNTNDAALRYSNLAEQSANIYTDEIALRQNNAMQLQFSDERASMKNYIENRIDLKIDKAMKERNR